MEANIRTTLNLKDDVIKQVMQITRAKNKSQAVNEVLETYVREKRTQKLFDLRGKLGEIAGDGAG